MITDRTRKTEILMRHEEKEPLNLSAVEDACPWLLEGLFEPDNFIGWWDTLEKAGLSYAKIRIEPALTVRCKLCDFNESESLWFHLQSEHGIKTAEYRMEFPHAEVLAEAARAERMGDRHGAKARVLAPHWEPAWSPLYALDRLHILHGRGVPLNYSHVAKHEPGFAAIVRRFFGSWDAGLEAIGLNPQDIREACPSREFTNKTLIATLRRKERERPGQLLVSAARGADAKVVVTAAFRLFGSYEDALAAARIDPVKKMPALADPARVKARNRLVREAKRRLKTKPPYNRRETKQFLDRHEQAIEDFYASWTNFTISLDCYERELFNSPGHREYDSPDRVVKGLRARHKVGLSLRDEGLRVDDPSLHIMANKHFGTIKDALAAAEVERPPHSYRRRDYPEPEDVVHALRRRHRKGLSLFANDLTAPAGEGGDRSLMKWARRYFGDYRKALKAAGVPDPGFKPPGSGPEFKYPDADAVLAEIRRRKANGKSLNAGFLGKPKRRGGDITLLKSARREFGSWIKAVTSAGFEIAPDYPKKRRPREKWNKQRVIDGILERRRKRLSVKAAGLNLSRNDGGDVSLYAYGKRLFGTWQKALKAAGIGK